MTMKIIILLFITIFVISCSNVNQQDSTDSEKKLADDIIHKLQNEEKPTFSEEEDKYLQNLLDKKYKYNEQLTADEERVFSVFGRTSPGKFLPKTDLD